jgi:hypothetical protein
MLDKEKNGAGSEEENQTRQGLQLERSVPSCATYAKLGCLSRQTPTTWIKPWSGSSGYAIAGILMPPWAEDSQGEHAR